VQSPKIAKIGVALCNLIYEYTLYGDSGLYYIGAYALSIPGGEDWRRRILGDVTELPAAFRTKHLNLNSDEEVEEMVRIAVEEEAEVAEEEEEAPNAQEEFVPSARDAALVSSITARDHSRRLKSERKIVERVAKVDMFVASVFACIFGLS
jgi:hypothetical protein